MWVIFVQPNELSLGLHRFTRYLTELFVVEISSGGLQNIVELAFAFTCFFQNQLV